jgi:transcriptional regulator with XRE-family HTH domain
MAAAGFENNMRGLSRAAGLGPTYVRDLLTPGRKNNPKLGEIYRLADALGCTVTELMSPILRKKPQRTPQQLRAARFRAARWAVWGDDVGLAARWLEIEPDRLRRIERAEEPLPDDILRNFCLLTSCPLAWVEAGQMEGMPDRMLARAVYSDPTLVPDPDQDPNPD